jgi:glutamyl-tRNA reductase
MNALTLRRDGPVIEQLTRYCDTRRQEAEKNVLARLKGKLSDRDCEAIEKAFSRFQNQFLHGPISAITEETHAAAASCYTLAAAVRKLFRLAE